MDDAVMAQDLLTISQEAFSIQIHKIPTPQLKNLIEQIYELKRDKGYMFSESQVCDIERKETKINSELMNRGYLKSVDYEEYFQWLKSMQKRKRYK